MPESQAQPWRSGAGFGAACAKWRRQGRKGRFWSFLGPAFIGAIAYIDPGNFVTNIAAGSRYGDRLLWVVVYANLTAVAISMLAARLGIASGRNLAENCRVHLPRWISMFLWVAAKGAGVATDFAEVLGAVLGRRLVLGLSVGPALALIFGLCLVLADLSDRGHRALEYGMIAIVGIVGVLGIWQWHVARTAAFPWHLSALVVPGLPPGGLWMAVGLFGATVMPHAIFLQSATVLPRERRSPPAQRPALFRMAQADILVALGLASFINVAMLLTAAAIFVPRAMVLSSLTKAAHVIGQGLGPAAALGFGLALMASGARGLDRRYRRRKPDPGGLYWHAHEARAAAGRNLRPHRRTHLGAPGPRSLAGRKPGGVDHRPAIRRHPLGMVQCRPARGGRGLARACRWPWA